MESHSCESSMLCCPWVEHLAELKIVEKNSLLSKFLLLPFVVCPSNPFNGRYHRQYHKGQFFRFPTFRFVESVRKNFSVCFGVNIREVNRCAAARINQLTPITCLLLAANVHMLDEPRSVIEDVRPVPPAAPSRSC